MPTRRQFLNTFLKGSGCFLLGAGAVSPALARRGASGRFSFPQGVASGDPTADSVVLWTRVVDQESRADAIPLQCEVAMDKEFRKVVARRELTAHAESDFTVRVLVHDLEPGTIYHYRFTASGDVSDPTGRTRTAPAPGDARPVRFAWASCQGYEAGYFGAYRTLLNRDRMLPESEQVEFIMHAGDFIYEKLGYGSTRQVPPFPDGESGEDGNPFAVSLADYRHLYKVYLADPDLKAARAWWPFIVTWDDHEFTNDCWQSMATYSLEGEPSQARKYHANRAWFEFIPALLTEHPGTVGVPSEARDFETIPGGVENRNFEGPAADQIDREANNRKALESLCIYRSFRWGKQVELVLTDTRSYRTDHCIPDTLNHKISGTAAYMSPLPLVKIFDAGKTYNNGNPPREIPLGETTIPNPRAESEPGTMLGQAQKAWFKATLKASDANWKIWGNSVPSMPMRLDMDQIDPKATPIVFTTDTWEGFMTERQELFDFIVEARIHNFISLVGDHHNHFAGALFHDFDNPEPRRIGAEFAVCGISSPSIFHALLAYVPEGEDFRNLVTFDSRPFGGSNPLENNLNVTFRHGTRAALTAVKTGDPEAVRAADNPRQNPHLAYVDSSANGIAVIRLEADRSEVEMMTVEPPWEDRGGAGARPLRSAFFELPAWEPGQPAPALKEPRLEGIKPFPLV